MVAATMRAAVLTKGCESERGPLFDISVGGNASGIAAALAAVNNTVVAAIAVQATGSTGATTCTKKERSRLIRWLES